MFLKICYKLYILFDKGIIEIIGPEGLIAAV
jgi:hypothetical protein